MCPHVVADAKKTNVAMRKVAIHACVNVAIADVNGERC